MSLHDVAIGLFVFFPVLTTITLGLRLFVRTRLCKGAFGWDDVALVVTYVGLLLWVAFAWESMKAGFGTERWSMFTAAKNDVCYIISGVVKISVALVLYRLDERLFMRAILVTDMAVCTIWTVVVTLILGLGCESNSPWDLGESVCEATNYAQEASYVIFNVLHIIIPIVIVWGVKIRGNLKWAVVSLFSVGIFAAIFAILKLQVYIELFNPKPTTDFTELWQRSMIWAICEHGASLFAASVLAVRPFFTYISSSLSTTLSSISSSSDKNNSASGRRDSGRASGAPSFTWPRPLLVVDDEEAGGGGGGAAAAGGGGGGKRGWSRHASVARSRDIELESRRASDASGLSTTKTAYTVTEFCESSQQLAQESKEVEAMA